jgi:mannan endo-1,4-beta-mannosidase
MILWSMALDFRTLFMNRDPLPVYEKGSKHIEPEFAPARLLAGRARSVWVGVFLWFCCAGGVAEAESAGTNSSPLLPVTAAPVDPDATSSARVLLRRLDSAYGKFTWSGQQDPSEMLFVKSLTGHEPLVVAADLIDYSPSRVAYASVPADHTERLIALARAGHVLSLSWHWNAPTNLLNTREQPWWKGFYTRASTFDVAAALSNTNSAEYALILRDIDAIAIQLKKTSDANIPVLWRPLHEAEGRWFWWGAKGPGPFKQLWALLFDRLTRYHGLHNLIWVASVADPAWYPGDGRVDVVGLDAYPADRGDLLLAQWQSLKTRFDGKKLLALTEFGGVPDIERMQRAGVRWSWFASWSGDAGPRSMPTNTVIRIYGLPTVVNAP